LVTDLEKMDLDRIAKRFGIDLQERPLPAPADVEAVVAERVTALLEARLRQRDKLLIERSQRFVPLGRSLAENEDESAIIAMLLDDYYQQTSLAATAGALTLRQVRTGQPAIAAVPPMKSWPTFPWIAMVREQWVAYIFDTISGCAALVDEELFCSYDACQQDSLFATPTCSDFNLRLTHSSMGTGR
jgi:hypothetical protein